MFSPDEDITPMALFSVRTRDRTRLGQYWAVMGYIFTLIREIDPVLKYTIDTFTLIGLVWSVKTVGGLLATTLNGIRVHLWSRLWRINLRRRYGEWAVITGATDGLGLEYARQLAQRDHSLILVGRNAEKLDTVYSELVSVLGANRVVTVQADFNNASSANFKAIAEQINTMNKDVGILVNNAGVMYKSPNSLLDQNEEEDFQQINVNCTAVVMMTRAVLPGMVKRKRGLVINLSSMAGYKPLPSMGVYSASKKFVEYFSKTLQAEYSQYNVDVQVLTPNYISTKMTQWSDFLQSSNFVFPDAKRFVASALATIGHSDNTTGYWSHGLQHFFYDYFISDWIYPKVGRYFLKTIDSTTKKIE